MALLVILGAGVSQFSPGASCHMLDKAQLIQELQLLADLCPDVPVLGIVLAEERFQGVDVLIGEHARRQGVVHQFEPANEI